MIITTVKETAMENRVAITPQTTKKYVSQGFKVIIESNAGIKSGFDDSLYISAGGQIKKNTADILRQSDILLKINSPTINELKNINKSSLILADFKNSISDELLNHIRKKTLNCFALEKLPRISKTQSFDISSSQDSLSGYQAVIKSAELLKNAIPMMITSAGTITAIKFLILGIGVAGLQAIATAKRLGGKVYAFDIRPETKEQAQSLGAIFVDNINDIITDIDVVITSAFTSGKKAPVLIKNKILKTMKTGSLLIDMAVSSGGNIKGSQADKTINIFNCQIYGNSNLASQIPQSASILFANNLSNFIDYLAITPTTKPTINKNDEIIKAALI